MTALRIYISILP